MLQANYKIGIDANRPIDPQAGSIAPQVADPSIIADTGAGWVRLNFVLSPWSSPNDNTQHAGRTWAETYRTIIDGLRGKGLQLYGLIGVEAVARGLGDELRNAPPSNAPLSNATDPEWISAYVANFLAIVRLFHQEIGIFESFNEPDDWHGSKSNWLHPGWFALILQRIYEAVKSDPDLAAVRLVSGPLQGLAINNNGAAVYLQNVYQEGKARFGWGKGGAPFPFDGVGYHLYITEQFKDNLSPAARQQELRDAYHRYLDGMLQTIRSEEGRDKPIFISEMGWHTNHNPETFQVDELNVGLGLVLADPAVELGIWFCTQDFGPPNGDKFYGLYRPGPLEAGNRKPAYSAYQAFCARQLAGDSAVPVGAAAGTTGSTNGSTNGALPSGVPGVHSTDDGAATNGQGNGQANGQNSGQIDNRMAIQAISLAAAELGQSRYELFERARLWDLFFDRAASYQGPQLDQLPSLTSAEAATVMMKINALRAGALARRGETTAELLNLRAGPGTDQAVLAQLPSQTPLAILAEQGEWLRVEAKGQEGFVHRSFVAILDQAPVAGFLCRRPDLAKIPLAPPTGKLIAANVVQKDEERRIAWIWNQYGRLLAAVADELKIDPAVAIAVLAAESGGQPFAGDGRMIIRFENHIFFEEWGKDHAGLFNEHFDFNRTPQLSWQDHKWRQSADTPWQPQHLWDGGLDVNQRAEWDVLNFAITLAAREAKLSISMGASQIMGFNYSTIGYESVEEMFDAFCKDERAHFLGFFDFIKGDAGRIQALQQRDYVAFASSYNGPGQAASYGAIMRQTVDLFDEIRHRQGGISFDLNQSFDIDVSGISFLPPLWPVAENPPGAGQSTPQDTSQNTSQAPDHKGDALPSPGTFPQPGSEQPAGQSGGQAGPVTATNGATTNSANNAGTAGEQPSEGAPTFAGFDDLKTAWINHVERGLENNNIMFNRILQGFMMPYYLTVVLYAVLIVVGLGLFVFAALASVDKDRQMTALVFGGLGVLAFLTFFISNPLRSLEQNLQFITWLGIVYNTYWTRLLYFQNQSTVDADLDRATQSTLKDLEHMIDVNTNLAKGRPSITNLGGAANIITTDANDTANKPQG